MSCGDNPEANMASNKDTDTLDAGQHESAGLNLSALGRELSLLVQAAAIVGDYNANRMSALATTLQRETRDCRRFAAPAATSAAVEPASAVRITVVASSTPATAAASVATSTLVPSAALPAVASSPMFHATSPGDDSNSWPPEPTRVPPSPPSVLDELRRAFHAVQEEEGLKRTREHTRRPIRDPVLVRRDSHPSASSMPAQFGSRPGRDTTAAPVAAIHTEMGVRVTASPRTES
eukprot:6185411-Pleurochrysis_carterae.AAC.9